MIHPKRDSLIALILTLAGLAGFAWGLQRLMTYGENDAPGGIAVAVGGLTAFFGLLAFLNFRWALRIARRMQRGEGIIARWTVPADTVTAYVALEAKRHWTFRSRWRPKPGKGAEILFSDDAILAGGRYHGLKSKGLQIFTAVQMVPGPPTVIEFLIREITTSSANNYAAGKFNLRIPVPPSAEPQAEKVLAHFRQIRDDAPADTRYWRQRQKIGLGILLFSVIAGVAGYILAQQSGWRADDTTGIVAMILMITGLMFGLMALLLTLIASAAVRRAARQGIRPAR
jgi:FtsH-binding integral membrane protein